MSNKPSSIGVLGAGAWGTALAIHLAKLHPQIQLWGRNTQALQKVISQKENSRYLPGAMLSDNIIPCVDFSRLVQTSDFIIVAVPSLTMREMMQRINSNASENLQGIIWACKGLEQGSGKFLHQIAEEELRSGINNAILSGPSFAQEVGKGLPTAVTVASKHTAFARKAARLFHDSLFRTYISTDVTGVEIGGTFKNILAIATGISDGLQFGANARAALITRGMAEMIRLGRKLGAHTQTFSGLSGLGDIVLTCTENLSRNRRFGLGIGSGKSLAQVEQEIGQVIEGKYAAKVVYDLAHRLGIELPISHQVYEVLYNGKPAREAVEYLISRSLKNEVD